MSGLADSPIPASCGAFETLRFAEYLSRVNQGERVERAAGRRTEATARTAAHGEACRHGCQVRADLDGLAPSLAEVSPTDATTPAAPPRESAVITIQQLLPIGSIIDVTV